MEIYCTRPGCARPVNQFPDLDDKTKLKAARQKFCTACGMPLLLQERYIPLNLLGRGGFGAAFLARDRFTPAMRLCVVKQFQPAGHLTAEQLQLAQTLFEREGEVLEDLGTHPQIPDLMAFFELDVPSAVNQQADRFFYLVQEFIDGKTLEDMLAQQGKFSEAEVTQMLLAILPVLQFVHDRHSIHRDIKPSNIMCRRDGLYYLLDFGAVKQVTSGAAVGGQAGRASTGIYSMGFAPPEQIRGDRVYPATDLYALAVTCLMLLTGKSPTDLYDNYSDQWSWRSYVQVSDRLEAILNRMLQATPSHRFQSAQDVITALQASPAQPQVAPITAPVPHTAIQAPNPSATVKSKAQVAPAQPDPKPTPVKPPPSRSLKVRTRRPFSLAELIGGAAFTGLEGGLLAIGIASLLQLAAPAWLIVFGVAVIGMILAQYLRWIEKIDLIILGTGTLLVVTFFPPAHLALISLGLLVANSGPPQILMVILPMTVLSALGAIAVALVFRLIYTVLSRWI